MLFIRTTGPRATALGLLLAALGPAVPVLAQPPHAASRFPVTPRASVTLDAPPFGSPALGAGLVFVATETGDLIAHRMADGAEQWRIALPMVQPPVALGDHVLAVVDGAIQARHVTDGREIWRVPTAALAAPLLAHEGWVIAATARALTALRAADGSVVWTRESPTLVTTPSIEGDRLYAPLADGRLQALALRTGEPVWSRRLGGPPGIVLAFADRLYLGSDDQHFYCLDARTGTVVWRFRVGSPVRGAPAAHGALVHTAALDNLVRAHDSRGHRVWNQGIPYRPMAGPLVAGGLLAVPGPSAALSVFDAETGKPGPAIAFEGTLLAPPAVGQDRGVAILAAVVQSPGAGWRLVLLDGSYRVPLAPLTALPGAPVPLWTPGKLPLPPGPPGPAAPPPP